jgi:hypothetical protein
MFQNVTNKMLNSEPAAHIPKLNSSKKLHASKFFTNINNSLFISMYILKDLPQQKNPRPLCPGSSPKFYMFPWKFSFL